MKKAVKDHDRNLIALLERCREKNIALNPKKLQLRKQEVPYIGHVLTPDGLKPDPSKIKAIVAMPTPSDKKAVQRVLGMITYLAKFLPNLSDVTEPLGRLLDKAECAMALERYTREFMEASETIHHKRTSVEVFRPQ